jgi:MFS transporter, DHA1 family, multidrug resistance protein
MDRQRKNKNFYLILILGLLTAIGPFSIDMYLPAFPAISKSMHTSVAEVMLSLSSFFIGISAGQLVYGPLLERFGRKRPLYGGLILYLLSSVGCAMATSAHALILFRLLQALGGCAGLVAARAIVRDLFDVAENARIFSMLMLVVAISPIIAPTAGGYITAALGWRYVFVVMILINIVILAGVYFWLPESKKPDQDFSMKAGSIFKHYVIIGKDTQFITYALTGAIAYAGLYAYVSGSPYVFMVLFGVNEKHFGWIFAFIAMGVIGSSQVNNMALRKFSSEQVIKAASLGQSIIGITLAILTLAGWSELYSTILLIFLFLCGQGFIFPNASALSLAPFGHSAGNASALMGAIQMATGAGASALVSILENHTALPMTCIMAACAITAFSVFTFGRKLIRYRARNELVKEEDLEMISTL